MQTSSNITEGVKLKYIVLSFPGLLGVPFETNWWIKAWIVARWRVFTLAYAEVRIINKRTGKYKVYYNDTDT
jgi:hypothetical protein